MTEQQQGLAQIDTPRQIDGQCVVRQCVKVHLDELRDEVVADIIEIDPVDSTFNAENVVGIIEVDREDDISFLGQRANEVGMTDVEARLGPARQTKRDDAWAGELIEPGIGRQISCPKRP
ncbi:MAG: hypothetical protein HND48_00450 [Chloroflexi bacterium]|nr:hypothetical protein [Chloroflexota bacterium]